MTLPFDAVAIANRGEIAVRIARACRELGLHSVALHAPDDADAMHVREADDAAEVPSYLDAGALAAAAARAGAGALHPGYGFLAEDAALAEACAAEDVRFVGPPPAALRSLARKDEARRIAQASGVPVVPGGDDPRALGLPLLVKAAAGGGGRGMRIVRALSELEPAIEAARREAKAAFGDETVLFERYVERPRHVEIQVLCDAHGNAVHLGERDCSVQRRHQKVLEEAPAPGLARETRAALGASALRLAAAVGYVGAGTAEFLVDGDGSSFFLEMNARIQVEHPVTELVASVDLVRRQLEIAGGLPLGLDQGALVLRGHAVEARVYAEDPDRGFLPQAGQVLALRWPGGPGVRVDAGVEEGDVVGVRYDPLLAKIVAHGETRERALARLASALEETQVVGVTTNLPFLRWLVADGDLRAGPVTTRFLEERFVPRPQEEPPAGVLEAAERFAARELGGNPWQGRFRPGARRPAPADPVVRGPDGALHVWQDGRSWRLERARLADAEALAHAPAAAGEEHARVTAPMPGTVLRVQVREGDEVAARETLLILEAMKMEHPLTAPFDGRVARVHVAEGGGVQAGDTLIELLAR
jgi:acetyl-CoA/propionyl-CoA carboxylase biotin carboxyl carrier protein